MDTNMILSELTESKEQKKGTYAAVRFSKKTIDSLLKFCVENDVKNPLAPSKFHTTLLYSRKFLPDLDITGELATPVIGTPEDFDVWMTRSEDPDVKPKRCLVLKYKCPELSARHKELMKEHGATYDFPDYTPHITLSYDIGDADVEELKAKVKDIGDIEIVYEYNEDLDLDYASKAGKG